MLNKLWISKAIVSRTIALESRSRLSLKRRFFHAVANQQGQTLIDAMIGVGLVAVTSLALVQLNSTSFQAGIRVGLMSEYSALYSRLTAELSTEVTCRIALGGSPNPPPIISGTGTQAFSESAEMTVYQYSGSQQMFIRAGAKYGGWTVKSITLKRLNPSDPIAPGVLPVQMTIVLQQTNHGVLFQPIEKTMSGLYFSVMLDSSLMIVSCTPLTLAATEDTMTTCGDTYAPQSTDQVTFKCIHISCPYGATRTLRPDGNLGCSTDY